MRQQKSKSKSKSTTHLSPKLIKISPKKQQPLTHQTFLQKFHKLVEQPLAISQQLAQIKVPQKCLIHNFNYNLYCQKDHKMLCTKCMYKNNTHIVHPIKPLTSCTQSLQINIEKSEKELNQIIQNIGKYKQYIHNKTNSIQKQYPMAKTKIQEIFKFLHQVLFDQEKECLKDLRIYKSQLLDELNVFIALLNKTKGYIEEKVKKYKDKKESDFLAVKKNIYDALKRVPKIITQLKMDISQKQEIFKIHPEIKNQLKALFEKKFVNWLARDKKLVEMKNVGMDLNKFNQSPSKQKGNASPSKTPGKIQKVKEKGINKMKVNNLSAMDISASKSPKWAKDQMSKSVTHVNPSQQLLNSKIQKLNSTKNQATPKLMYKPIKKKQPQKNNSKSKEKSRSKSQQKSKSKINKQVSNKNNDVDKEKEKDINNEKDQDQDKGEKQHVHQDKQAEEKQKEQLDTKQQKQSNEIKKFPKLQRTKIHNKSVHQKSTEKLKRQFRNQ